MMSLLIRMKITSLTTKWTWRKWMGKDKGREKDRVKVKDRDREKCKHRVNKTIKWVT